ncbi:MAG: hypothetical protein Q9182_005075 [Xanthomendoza sp. 2 TL-2023]
MPAIGFLDRVPGVRYLDTLLFGLHNMKVGRILILSLFGLPSSLGLRRNPNKLNASLCVPPNVSLLGWPIAPWTLSINDGFIEFEYYCRQFFDSTGATARLIAESLTDIAIDLQQTFDPSTAQDKDWTWSYPSRVARFDLHLEPETPATKEDILYLFSWMQVMTRRWDESPAEIGNAGSDIREAAQLGCDEG